MENISVFQTFKKGKDEITLYRKTNIVDTDIGPQTEIIRKVKINDKESHWTNAPQKLVPESQFQKLEDILWKDMSAEIKKLESESWKKIGR